MPPVGRAAQAQAGRLLRVLFVQRPAVSAARYQSCDGIDMRECQRLCAALGGRTIGGWRVVSIDVRLSSSVAGYAQFTVHVEPMPQFSGPRPHWASSQLPLDRLRELLRDPLTLLSDLFPPEDAPHVT